MKKLGFIFVLFALIFGGGWVVHLVHHEQEKTLDAGLGSGLIEGNDFLNIGRYDEAKRLFTGMLTANPENEPAAWGLEKAEAKAIATTSKYKETIDSLYQRNPNDAHVNLFMGEFYLDNHELEKALLYFQQALKENPRFAEVHFDLARLYYQQNNFNAARSEISLALDIAPTARYHNYSARAYIKLNHIDAAVAEYEKNTEYPLSALEVAQIYWQRDRLDLALVRQLQAAQWLNDKEVMAMPENRDPWFFRISAEQTIMLSKLEEKKAYAYLNVAFTLHLLENKEESAEYLQKMTDLAVIRQRDIHTIMDVNLGALVLEKYSATGQAESFKKLYQATLPQ